MQPINDVLCLGLELEPDLVGMKVWIVFDDLPESIGVTVKGWGGFFDTDRPRARGSTYSLLSLLRLLSTKQRRVGRTVKMLNA